MLNDLISVPYVPVKSLTQTSSNNKHKRFFIRSRKFFPFFFIKTFFMCFSDHTNKECDVNRDKFSKILLYCSRSANLALKVLRLKSFSCGIT
jgi:hypothetical protein